MFKIWRLAVCTFSFIASSVAFAQSPSSVLIDDIEIRGNRRVPRETILYAMQSKPGDVYSESLARQDLEAIMALGFFDPMSARLYTADGSRGGRILVFELREYPVIRALEYHNLKAVTESEILTRFKERRVGLGKDSPFDPVKATAARRVLR